MSKFEYDFARGHPNSSLVPVDEIKEIFRTFCSSDEKDGILQRALNYGPDEGDMDFRSELMSFLTRHCSTDENPASRFELAEANYFQTGGVSHGIELVVAVASQPGDVVMVEQPTYYLIAAILESHSLKAQNLPMNEAGIDVDVLAEQLESGSVDPPRLVYLIPTNQNPTGRTISLADRQKLVDLAYRYNFLIVADEVYHLLDWRSELSEGEGQATIRPSRMAVIQPSHSAEPPETLVGCCSVSSFTKIFAPGVRCGWVEGSTDLIRSLTKYGYIQSQGGIGPLVGAMMTHSLNTLHVDRSMSKLCHAYHARASTVYNILRQEPRIKVPHGLPTGGYFLWVSFPFRSDNFLDFCHSELHFMLGSKCCAATANEGAENLDSYARLCFADMDTASLKEASYVLVVKVRHYCAFHKIVGIDCF